MGSSSSQPSQTEILPASYLDTFYQPHPPLENPRSLLQSLVTEIKTTGGNTPTVPASFTAATPSDFAANIADDVSRPAMITPTETPTDAPEIRPIVDSAFATNAAVQSGGVYETYEDDDDDSLNTDEQEQILALLEDDEDVPVYSQSEETDDDTADYSGDEIDNVMGDLDIDELNKFDLYANPDTISEEELMADAL